MEKRSVGAYRQCRVGEVGEKTGCPTSVTQAGI
jgi:hypothetical protein